MRLRTGAKPQAAHFFPTGFYDYLSIPYRLAEGMQLHFFFMWPFAGNGLIYVLYTIFSGEWRALVPVPSCQGSGRRETSWLSSGAPKWGALQRASPGLCQSKLTQS